MDPRARYERELHVIYPAGHGRIVLTVDARAEGTADPADPGGEVATGAGSSPERELEAEDAGADATRTVFRVTSDRPFTYVRPVLIRQDGTRHPRAKATLLLMTGQGPRRMYPNFEDGTAGTISGIQTLTSPALGRDLKLRVYTPPGYGENWLKHYPTLYMHDGGNLFFPDEAFVGKEWQVDETLDQLGLLSVVDKAIVVGIHAGREAGVRDREYTRPGYERYGRCLVEELRPWIDAEYRTLLRPEHRLVVGSSLGGVVSFYLAWEYPEVFGKAACLSSTFGWRDDLMDRVLAEDPRPLRVYLDSGWPGDNYEVTRAMAAALEHRGYAYGCDFLHLVFPRAVHDEDAWATRLHLPFQFLLGKSERAAEALMP